MILAALVLGYVASVQPHMGNMLNMLYCKEELNASAVNGCPLSGHSCFGGLYHLKSCWNLFLVASAVVFYISNRDGHLLKMSQINKCTWPSNVKNSTSIFDHGPSGTSLVCISWAV